MTKTASASTAFFALAEGWELDEAQSLHAAAEEAFAAAMDAQAEQVCSRCGGVCEHHLLPQAEQASRSALLNWLEGRDNTGAKRAAFLWEQVEAPGEAICLACFAG